MKKQSKTPLFNTLRRAFQIALKSEKDGIPVDEALGQSEERRISRRKFLENTGKTALIGGMVPSLWAPSVGGMLAKALNPRIAIVGGGMAGLNALHTLKKSGLDATIYESSNRTGGRIFTVREVMGPGTWTEYGGEFIDTDHEDMWKLIREFKLETIDYAQASETKLIKEAYFFNGRHYSEKEVVEAFRAFAPRMQEDMDKLEGDINYETKDPFIRQLDNTPLSKYLEQIGAKGWIKDLIEVAYESEYGLSPQVQSCLNLLILISTDTSGGSIEWFGESDERYKVKHGNQRVPDAVAQLYTNHIKTGFQLEALRSSGSSYTLHFSGKSEPVKADYVIMTIPFAILRHLDIEIEMSPLKRKCINELGFGSNAKLMLSMKNHFWRGAGYTGLCYAGNGIPNGWDNAQLQTADNQAAGLSILFGGKKGIDVGKSSPEKQKDKYLKKWDKIYPGARQAYNGKVTRMHWPSYPHAMGSYICPTLGQYTSLIGLEQMPVGNVFFAGEHCGGDYAGFMNGAAQSGRQAAEAILMKVKG